MLRKLKIENVGIIDNIELDFQKGFNVFTGETGAGKSLIISSLNGILGSKLPRSFIRSGTERAYILAEFLYEEKSYILEREIYLVGKNNCYINGETVKLNEIKNFAEKLIDIYGQYDNQSLLRVESHIGFLDQFGDSEIVALKANYQSTFNEYVEINKRIRSMSINNEERRARIDLLKFQIDEIEKAAIEDGEEEKLIQTRKILLNALKITETLSLVYANLFENDLTANTASDLINTSISEMQGVSEFSDDMKGIFDDLKSYSFNLSEMQNEMRSMINEIELNPEMLKNTEERLDLISDLKRKYGEHENGISDYYDDALAELELLENRNFSFEDLSLKLKKTKNELFEFGNELHLKRLECATRLENLIEEQFVEIEMQKAEFKVDIDYEDENENYIFEDGMEKVEFLISTNTGEPLKPLARIASGGEMSRIMLAIKTILANVGGIDTLVFDEIDSGISGITAGKIAEKLYSISMGRQVICVTHLPQIAAMADLNILVKKTETNKQTTTNVAYVRGEEIVKEISLIAGGTNVGDEAVRYVKKLIENANEYKLSKNVE